MDVMWRAWAHAMDNPSVWLAVQERMWKRYQAAHVCLEIAMKKGEEDFLAADLAREQHRVARILASAVRDFWHTAEVAVTKEKSESRSSGQAQAARRTSESEVVPMDVDFPATREVSPVGACCLVADLVSLDGRGSGARMRDRGSGGDVHVCGTLCPVREGCDGLGSHGNDVLGLAGPEQAPEKAARNEKAGKEQLIGVQKYAIQLLKESGLLRMGPAEPPPTPERQRECSSILDQVHEVRDAVPESDEGVGWEGPVSWCSPVACVD